jgi:hypothetical protein
MREPSDAAYRAAGAALRRIAEHLADVDAAAGLEVAA